MFTTPRAIVLIVARMRAADPCVSLPFRVGLVKMDTIHISLRRVNLGLYLLLLSWFTLDLIGIPGLVTRDDWLSPAGLLELLLILILTGFWLQWKAVPVLQLVILSLWGYLQYIAHWHGFLFGASSHQLLRYYALFAGTARFIPASQTRIVPDAYHMILGVLIALNLWAGIFQAIVLGRFRIRQKAEATNGSQARSQKGQS